VNRQHRGWRDKLRLVMIIGGGVLLLVLLYLGGRWLEGTTAQPEIRGDHRQRYAYEDTVEIDGVAYRKRQEVKTVLLMGVDRDSGAVVSGGRNGGQADFLQLVVSDAGRQRLTLLAIDRDTMTPITILGVLGNRSGVREAQICLSHGFGDGGAQSCELTVQAVSNLLLGTPIDAYAAMNMDGISVLNDALGGVTVTLVDDFSALDPAMRQGATLTLRGEQAELFVRGRRSVGIGTNEARMARQQLYIGQMMTLLDAHIHEDKSFMGALYDELKPYLVTDMSRGAMINQAWAARDYSRETISLAGAHAVDAQGFMEFRVDEEALKALVLELFYEQVK